MVTYILLNLRRSSSIAAFIKILDNQEASMPRQGQEQETSQTTPMVFGFSNLDKETLRSANDHPLYCNLPSSNAFECEQKRWEHNGEPRLLTTHSL